VQEYQEVSIHFLIMAGGKGTRFGDAEKCMSAVNGIPVLENLLNQVSKIAKSITVSTTIRHVKTVELCISRGIQVVYTDGNDYVRDLRRSLAEIRRVPVLVLGSDTFFTDMPYFRSLISSSLKENKEIIEFLQHKNMTGISIFNRIPENESSMNYEEVNSERDYVININTKDDLDTVNLRL